MNYYKYYMEMAVSPKELGSETPFSEYVKQLEEKIDKKIKLASDDLNEYNFYFDAPEWWADKWGDDQPHKEDIINHIQNIYLKAGWDDVVVDVVGIGKKTISVKLIKNI